MFPRRRLLPICRQVLLVCGLILAGQSLALEKKKKEQTITLPAPLKFELTQLFSPLKTRDRLTTERWKFSTGSKSFILQHSNQAPSLFSGRQFQSLPSGYGILQLSIDRKWGAIQTFRSTGSSSRLVSARDAYQFTGMGLDLPRGFLGSKLGAYLLHASPEARNKSSETKSTGRRQGAQFGLTLSRNLTKKFKLQSEWAKSWQEARRGELQPDAGSRQGFHLKLSGDIRRAQVDLTYRARGEGLVNPAAPARARATRNLTADVRRTYKKHTLQLTSEVGAERDSRVPRLSLSDTRTEMARWSYAPAKGPQFSARKSWKRLYGGGKAESENDSRLSVKQPLKRITLDLTYLRADRIDGLDKRALWKESGITGDARLELSGARRLNIRYENTSRSTSRTSELLRTEKWKMDTRLSIWKGRITIEPRLDFRRQKNDRGTLDTSTVHFLVSSLCKLPRYFPGADLLITFSSDHSRALGKPDRNGIGLSFQWTLKRL